MSGFWYFDALTLRWYFIDHNYVSGPFLERPAPGAESGRETK